MLIKKIKLCNYRNYEEVELEFAKDANVLYGDNAQGKTNILESIYMCGTTKSHLGSKDKEIIRIGENESHIKMYVEKNGLEHKIDMHLKKNNAKGIAINGVPIRKSSELVGMINIIIFSPEDLNIIKNGPAERRRFLDMELCQLDRIYIDNLSRYNKALSQRNQLLKQIRNNDSLRDTLFVWDDQLLRYGKEIIRARHDYIENISPVAAQIHDKLTGGREDLSIIYEPNVNEEDFEEKLLNNHERDIYNCVTHYGPHRDDMKFVVKNMDIRTYGSQGQKRTAALSLKLSEIEIVKNKTNDTPVLLLDDVLSELDRNRQNYLLDCLKGVQTIITCTGLEEFIRCNTSFNKIYKVVNGTVDSESIRNEV